MRKTTVYLPGQLKSALEAMAASTGRSEADLIREAVASYTTGSRRARPRLPLFDGAEPISERVDELLGHGFGLD